MKRFLLALLIASVPLGAQSQLPPATSVKVDYEKDVKPILAQNCYGCHGPEVQQSGLRLDLRQNALRGGDYGPVITPGRSEGSKLIRRVVDGDGGMQMPPTGPLTADEIAILRAWIDQGAEFRTSIPEEAPRPAVVDPKIAGFITLVRSGSAGDVSRQLAADHALATARDPAGSTALHHAAGFGTPETMAALIAAGADINARNTRGSTPLLWAIHDEAKVRMLVERGALVNAKQIEGRTPLYQAASLGGGGPVVRFLLARGADPNIATAIGMTPLMAAATRGDVETMRLLLDANANVRATNGAGETALMWAASDGNPEAVAMLLARGADARVRTKRNESALGNAATTGVEETVKLLLDAGGEINVRNIRGYSPLMLAAGSDTMPATIVKTLLARGADTSHTADYDENARDLAAKRGNTEVTRLLGGLPQPGAASRPRAAARRDPRLIPEAVTRALALVEKQSHTFIRTAGCNSCHSQQLPAAVNGFARGRNLRVPREIPVLPLAMTTSPERLMDLSVVSINAMAWDLFEMGMNGIPPNAYSDAIVRMLAAAQTSKGNWSASESRRPPMNAGEFQAAALIVYALQHYTPAAQKTATDRAVARAADWLETAAATTTQDRAFRALGLAWAGRAESAKQAARLLLAMQRADGGWSQLPTLESDAYATGQALFALSIAGKLPARDAPIDRGVQYLLRTQADDGSWHVKSRSIWLQPYFESGFPYGRDQFISTAGTAWASLALAATVDAPLSTHR